MHKIKLNSLYRKQFFSHFLRLASTAFQASFLLRSALSAPNTFRPSFGFANVEP